MAARPRRRDLSPFSFLCFSFLGAVKRPVRHLLNGHRMRVARTRRVLDRQIRDPNSQPRAVESVMQINSAEPARDRRDGLRRIKVVPEPQPKRIVS
jgi:hypothetical protein